MESVVQKEEKVEATKENTVVEPVKETKETPLETPQETPVVLELDPAEEELDQAKSKSQLDAGEGSPMPQIYVTTPSKAMPSREPSTSMLKPEEPVSSKPLKKGHKKSSPRGKVPKKRKKKRKTATNAVDQKA